MKKIIELFIVGNRLLLFIASLVWAFPGGMLFSKALAFAPNLLQSPFLLLGYLGVGGLFYYLLFSKISRKVIVRLREMPYEETFIWAFFDKRGYLMMALMIGMGITLRKMQLIPSSYLAVIYLIMSVPLTISAFRYLYHAICFRKKNLLKR